MQTCCISGVCSPPFPFPPSLPPSCRTPTHTENTLSLSRRLTVRMLDNNVQSTNALVTFLVTLLDVLRHNGYTMTDGEASILLPSLVERVSGGARAV